MSNSAHERAMRSSPDYRRAIEVAHKIFMGLAYDKRGGLRKLPLHLSGLLASGKISELIRFEFPHGAYKDRLSFHLDYQAASLLSKFPFAGFEDAAEEAARRTFLESEDKCEATNQRFRGIFANPGTIPDDIRAVLLAARETIAEILGPFSGPDVLRRMRWTPGSNSAVRGSHVSAYKKYQVKPECSPRLRHAAGAIIGSNIPWLRCFGVDPSGPLCFVDLEVTPYNEVAFVPKNAKTKRTIALEPHMNSYVQSGIGRAMRSKLLAFGIDLNDQSVNQDLASFGSVTDYLATLDLKGASDGVATLLVEWLFMDADSGWYDALWDARSDFGLLPDGSAVRYQKFSSMGNGATFELESLLFYALLKGATRHLSVYGDDIVIDGESYARAVSVLEFCGFQVNQEKSFASGPFRESCGGNYFQGVDVTPYRLDSIPSGPVGWNGICNGISRAASRLELGAFRASSLRDAYRHAYAYILPGDRYPVPDHLGDAGIWDYDFAAARRPLRRGWEGYSFPCWITQELTREVKGPGLLAVRLSEVRGSYSFSDDWLARVLSRKAVTPPVGDEPEQFGSGAEIPLRRGATQLVRGYATTREWVPPPKWGVSPV